MTIDELVREATDNARAHGFHDPPPTFGDRIALIHSELSEALEEHYPAGWSPETPGDAIALKHADASRVLETFRKHGAPTPRPPGGHPLPEVYYGPGGKPEGVPIELADAVIRIADLCGAHGIDLESALRIKLAFNRTRPRRHGGKAL